MIIFGYSSLHFEAAHMVMRFGFSQDINVRLRGRKRKSNDREGRLNRHGVEVETGTKGNKNRDRQG
jgi:hypothetical protein